MVGSSAQLLSTGLSSKARFWALLWSGSPFISREGLMVRFGVYKSSQEDVSQSVNAGVVEVIVCKIKPESSPEVFDLPF